MENLSEAALSTYVNSQVVNFFPDGVDCKSVIRRHIAEAMDRMLFSIKHVKLPGYTSFSVLHSDLYAQFLYFLSNTIWNNEEDKNASGKLYYLNKALHAINCMYDTKLPDIFILIHCVGSVLGKASYADYFVACHNVTVGSDKGISPVLNEGVYMGPGSSIIGNCNIGKFTHLAINSIVLDANTNDEALITGSGAGMVSRQLKRNIIKEQYFKFDN